ncbi:MAG: tartrate dehydrogenase, partial [Actinobacteria bacterium]|nr:tartrate dehydrogenase [Actinomycetota bacterium]
MATHKMAIVKGDGIGVDVVNEGMKVLDALAPKYGITWAYTELPWSSDYYFKNGQMMPDDALVTLEDFNAVFLGAVGH